MVIVETLNCKHLLIGCSTTLSAPLGHEFRPEQQCLWMRLVCLYQRLRWRAYEKMQIMDTKLHLTNSRSSRVFTYKTCKNKAANTAIMIVISRLCSVPPLITSETVKTANEEAKDKGRAIMYILNSTLSILEVQYMLIIQRFSMASRIYSSRVGCLTKSGL